MNDDQFHDYLVMARNLCNELNEYLEDEWIQVADLLDALASSGIWIEFDHDATAPVMYAELLKRKAIANGSK